MVEMYVVIYDKSNIDDKWWKAVLDFPKFIYLLENCNDLGEVHSLLNTFDLWSECDEPSEFTTKGDNE